MPLQHKGFGFFRSPDLVSGELSDNDKVTYGRSLICGRLRQSPTLRQQAAANSKEPFANSPLSARSY